MPSIITAATTSTTNSKKRRLNDDDETQSDCEIVDVTPSKRAKANQGSSFLQSLTNPFTRIASWFRNNQKENAASKLFGAVTESNSAEEAIAHGGQYIDEATRDKFMQRQYITNFSNGGAPTGYQQQTQPGYQQQNRTVQSGVPYSNGPTESAYYNQTQQSRSNSQTQQPRSESVSPKSRSESCAQKCVTMTTPSCQQASTNTSSSSKFKSVSRQNSLLHTAEYNSSQSSASASAYKAYRSPTLNRSNASYQMSSQACSRDCSLDDTSGGGDMSLDNSSLHRSYIRGSQPVHSRPYTSSIYDQTYNKYSNPDGNASRNKKTLVEQCFDLAQKKKYQELIEQFTGGTDKVNQPGSLPSSTAESILPFDDSLTTSMAHTSAIASVPVRKSIFQMPRRSVGATPFRPQQISTPSIPDHMSGLKSTGSLLATPSGASIYGTPVQQIHRKPPTGIRPTGASKLEREKRPPVSPSALQCAEITKKLDDIRERVCRNAQDRKFNGQEREVAAWDELRKQNDDKLERLVEQRLKLHSRVVLEDLPVEEEEDEFPELSDEANQMVDSALAKHVPGEKLSEAFRLKITRGDMATLEGLQWLNDEIMNFYMNLIMDRSEKNDLPSVYVFNTFFHGKLMKTGHDNMLKRWTRKVDIFSKHLIIIPVHLGMHWCLAAIDLRNKVIKYFDSMGGSDHGFLVKLKAFLESESLDKKKQKFDTSSWTLQCVKDIPQQQNGSDCGVFACKYAEYLSRDSPFTFKQENMPYFRRRMIYEILNKKLL